MPLEPFDLVVHTDALVEHVNPHALPVEIYDQGTGQQAGDAC